MDKSVCFISFDPPSSSHNQQKLVSLPGWKELPLNGASRDLWPWLKVKVKVKSLSRVRFFETVAYPWTVAYHAPLSMGFFQARVLEWTAIGLRVKSIRSGSS